MKRSTMSQCRFCVPPTELTWCKIEMPGLGNLVRDHLTKAIEGYSWLNGFS